MTEGSLVTFYLLNTGIVTHCLVILSRIIAAHRKLMISNVMNFGNISGRNSTADVKPCTTQRCLSYAGNAEVSPISGLGAAEKLASFSALPTDSIDQLELISCATCHSSVKSTRISLPSDKCTP